jgi:hypothetical protein
MSSHKGIISLVQIVTVKIKKKLLGYYLSTGELDKLMQGLPGLGVPAPAGAR